MPAIARKNSTDSVQSPHGTGPECTSPEVDSTDVGSNDVRVNGIGVVREGDTMIPHNKPGCTTHAPPLGSFSSLVFANGKRIGRIGDAYIGDGVHPIISGSPTVFDGSPQTS